MDLYAALRGLSYLGRGSMINTLADYQKGSSWSDIGQNNVGRINELKTWVREFIRTTNAVIHQLRSQPSPRPIAR
jgi:hypothetical protein